MSIALRNIVGKWGFCEMKQYSYLNYPNGLESNYREIQVVIPDTTKWTIYRCMKNDCLEKERFVAVRQYTRDRLTADTLERIIADIWRYEY